MRQNGEEWHTTQLLHALFFRQCPNFSKQHKTEKERASERSTHKFNTSEQCFLTIRDLNQNNGKTTVFGDMTARGAWKKPNNLHYAVSWCVSFSLSIFSASSTFCTICHYISLKSFSTTRPPLCYHRV